MPRRCQLALLFLLLLSRGPSAATVDGSPLDSCHNYRPADYNSYEEEPSAIGFGVSELFRVIDCKKDDVNAFSTLSVAIFTAVLAAYTMSLGRSTRKAIDVARDEFLSSNRPKIRVKHFLASK